MHLNTLKPARGSKIPKKRCGRGIASGLGKTSGRGHKGQYARSGGYHKVGFQGGQMPLQRVLGKVGFNSLISKTRSEIHLSDLMHLNKEIVDMNVLLEAGLINRHIRKVKLIATGEVTEPIIVRGLSVSAGAKALIEAANGKVEEPFKRIKSKKKKSKKQLSDNE